MSLQTPARWVRAAGPVVLPWAFFGCALLPSGIEAPRVTVSDLELVHATLLEQRYRIVLTMQNPNTFDLPIDGLRYVLVLNGKEFAAGVSDERVTLPRLGTAHLDVEAVSGLLAIYRQISGLESGAAGLDYRLHGDLFVVGGRRLPFDYRGAIGGGNSQAY
jgi:LEA14-like dessication related protein